jgi:hypothetical protein
MVGTVYQLPSKFVGYLLQNTPYFAQSVRKSNFAALTEFMRIRLIEETTVGLGSSFALCGTQTQTETTPSMESSEAPDSHR